MKHFSLVVSIDVPNEKATEASVRLWLKRKLFAGEQIGTPVINDVIDCTSSRQYRKQRADAEAKQSG